MQWFSRQATLGRGHLDFDLKIEKESKFRTVRWEFWGRNELGVFKEQRGPRRPEQREGESGTRVVEGVDRSLSVDPRSGLLVIKSIPPEGEEKGTEWICWTLCTLWAKQFMSTVFVASSVFKACHNLFLWNICIVAGALACPSALAGLKWTYFVFVGRGKVGQAVLAFQAWSPGSIAGPGLHGNEK